MNDRPTPDDLIIEDMRFSPERGMDMRLRHPLFATLTEQICNFFAESGATNYAEFSVYSDRFGTMNVCVQRAEGMTPAQKNTQLQRERDEARAENEALRDALRVAANQREALEVCPECGFASMHMIDCRYFKTESEVMQ